MTYINEFSKTMVHPFALECVEDELKGERIYFDGSIKFNSDVFVILVNARKQPTFNASQITAIKECGGEFHENLNQWVLEI